MNEEPKSIWKKPWKGPRAFMVLLAVLALTPLATMRLVALVCDLRMNQEEWLLAAWVGGGMAGCGLLILCLIKAIRWLWCWRNLRRFLFGIACTATAIALSYAEENWRGKRAWEQFKREREAKGERFDLASIVPPPVPDDQNFAMAPIWVETVCSMLGAERGKVWYGDKVAALGHTNFTHRLAMPLELQGKGLDFTNSSNSGGWQKGAKPDLKLWQDYYRRIAAVTNYFPTSAQPQTPAEDVLLALSRYDSTIDELRQASERPYSRFPVGYTDADPASTLLPHLAPLKGCAMTLHLRAIAELQADQTDKALQDIELMLRLTAAVRSEPYLIAHLVRMAMVPMVLQPVWEGLADHRWTDAQLAALDAELGRLDFLADYQLAMRGERVFDVGIINFLRHTRNVDWLPFEGEIAGRFRFPLLLFPLSPSGWLEQNKAACCRMNLELLAPIANRETRVVSPAAEARARKACEQAGQTPFDWLTGLLLPGLSLSAEKVARAQTAADLARVACVLERYRLANGQHPETLASLSPRFLEKIPRDIIGGQPLKYRRADDGAFVLYSIGWNEKDDGGAFPTTRPADTAKRDRYGDSVRVEEGDWVWRYPAK